MEYTSKCKYKCKGKGKGKGKRQSERDEKEVEDEGKSADQAPNEDKYQEDNKGSAKAERYPLLERLLGLYKTQETINPVLAGYVGKVLQVLMDRRHSELLDYLVVFQIHMQNIVRHIYNQSVAELLLKLLSNEDKLFSGTPEDEHIHDKLQVIIQLLKLMESSKTEEVVENSCEVVCGLIDKRQHIEYFLNGQGLELLCNLATSTASSSMIAGLACLSTLLRLKLSRNENVEQICFFGGESLQRTLSVH